MRYCFPTLFTLIVCTLLAPLDAEAGRRGLRVDFGAWSDALPFSDFRCEGGFENNLDVIWRGNQFSGTANSEFTTDTYCQVPNEFSEPDQTGTFDYLNQEIFGPDEAGLAAKIGSNDSDDLSKRVTAIRYTFLDEDRFSEDPLPSGYQWAFYFFPGEITLVTIYGEIPIGNGGFEPTIFNRHGTLWDSATEGYDGEYFCFEGSLYIGTWDGILHEPGDQSRCELLLGELIFDGGFENRASMNENGFYADWSGAGSDSEYYQEVPMFLEDFNGNDLPDLVMLPRGFLSLPLHLRE